MSDGTAHAGHPLASGVRGLHHRTVSTANQRAVLTLVATTPGITNAELSRRIGLGPQTVSRFLNDLETRGLIRRGEPLRGHLGQPAIPYTLVYESVGSVGIAVGPRSCDLVLMDMAGVPKRSERVPCEAGDATGIVGAVAAGYAELTDQLTREETERLLGFGLCLQRDDAHAEVPLRALSGRLEDALGLSARRYDMGGAAAWAEHAAPGSPWQGDFAYVHVGDVVVAGMVRNGRLWRGSESSMRLADMLVPDGQGVARLGSIGSRLAFEAQDAESGADRAVSRSLDRLERSALASARAFALAIVNMAALTGIPRVVLGGDLPARLLSRLCTAVRDEMAALCARQAPPVVAIGRAGPQAPAIGAAYLPLYDRLFSREASA